MNSRIKHKSLRSVFSIVISLVILLLIFSNYIVVYAQETTNNVPVIVSLGDSFSSGEGIEPFYGQDELLISNKVKNEDWLAHRSTKSWGGMLTLPSVSGTMAENRNTNWFFAAVSGATTEHISDKNQLKSYWYSLLHKGDVYLPLQIEVFDTVTATVGKNETDYVTMTLGGNDAGFSDVILEAFTNNPFTAPNKLTNMINQTWTHFYEDEGIRDNLQDVYQDIERAAGKQAKIIVAGYPKLLDSEGSKVAFSAYDATIINNAVTNFNSAIKNLIQECSDSGIQIYFVSVEEAFEGHGAYSDDPYIRNVDLWTHSEDLVDFTSWTTDDDGNTSVAVASSYSMHPNEKGAIAYAACVQAKINELEGVVSDSSTSKYSTEILLSVYDVNSNLYGDYTIDITGTYNSGWFGWSWFEWFTEEYEAHLAIDKASTQSISLEPNGEYTITISDNNDKTKSYSKTIQVKEKYDKNQMIFTTDFGALAENVVYGKYDSADIPSDAVEFNGHYYYVYNIDTGTTWEDAKQYCESQGGYLATITSPEEQTFISGLVQNQAKRSYWIGLTDTKEPGNWEWVTDEPFSYSNWGQNEPNHGYGGKEHYVAVVSYDTEYDYPIFRGEWNDHANDRDIGQFGFICEWGECSTNFTSPSEDQIEMNGAFGKYLAAVSKTTESGSWTEQLSLEADLLVTNGSSKTKTKMTLNSTSDVSNYIEGNLSNIQVSSISDMTIMGQTYAWSTEYQDGVAHYQYTEPVQTSQDLEIDPNFFDFDVITQEAIINEEISGNQLRFTISGDSMAAAGIAAVEQMNGVDNLKYGDVEVTVTLSNLDTVETIVMVFDASMEYQGFNSDVSYHIEYRFV